MLTLILLIGVSAILIAGVVFAMMNDWSPAELAKEVASSSVALSGRGRDRSTNSARQVVANALNPDGLR